MSNQLEEIVKSKNKAFAVLIKTKKQLEDVVARASEFISKNATEIDEKKDEIFDLTQTNKDLYIQIGSVGESISEIDKILKPSL